MKDVSLPRHDTPGHFYHSRSFWIGLGIAAQLIASAALAISVLMADKVDPTYNFIALVILFMSGLTLTAAILSALDLTDRTEAFGLPAGSVRVLLAIGVMILFVVFGLPMIDPSGAGEAVVAKPTPVSAADLQKEIAFHRAQGLQVRVLNYGTPANGAVPGTPAVFETFGRIDQRSPSDIEFGRQLLTAIATLLTSVISFYFGSRSAELRNAPAGVGGGGSAGGTPATAPSAERARIAAGIDAATTALAATAQHLQGLIAAVPAADARRREALAAFDDRRQQLEQEEKALTGLLAAADKALTEFAATTDAVARAAKEAEARAALAQADQALTKVMQAQRQLDLEILTL